MKRLLMVLVALGILATPSRIAAQQIAVGPGSDLSSLVGVPIDVPFVADMSARTERLGSFALRIQWDTTKLRLVWGATGSFGDGTVNADSQPFGIVRLAGANPAGATGRVTLAVARLTPLVRDTTTIRFSLTELYAAGTFANLLPSAVVASGAYCPARGRWGDIDGDGNANSRDALIALSNAVGLDVSAFDVGLGDVDGSGTTNARDALIVLSNAVGVDVSTFRVLRMAAGACAANAARALSIVPADVELVVGQTVRLEARAGDVAGGLQAIPDVTWQSDRPSVFGLMADGTGLARDTGTVIVTVRRDLQDSARATFHVVARRTTHWVDATASGATNRLGTPGLPFGNLNDGVRFAQAGDTVRVRVGVYDLLQDGTGTLYLNRPLVVIGDTATDGSRPAIAGTSSLDGVVFNTTGSVEIQNLDVSGFATAFVVSGPTRALLRGVRVSQTGIGLRVAGPAGSVRLERSRLVGPGSVGEGYGGIGVQAAAVVDTLTIEDTEISDFGYGVYDTGMRIDSLTVRRSLLHDAGYASLYYYYCYQCIQPAPDGARPAGQAQGTGYAPVGSPRGGADPTSQAVVVERSRLARTFTTNAVVSLATVLRRAAFAHNALTNPSGNVLSIQSYGTGHLSMTGDSIVAPPGRQHNVWLDARDLDSLVLDSVVAIGYNTGEVYSTPRVLVSNTVLRDIRYNGLWMSATVNGAALGLSNVGFYGDPRDDVAASGLVVSGTRVTIDRLTAVNLSVGVNAGGDSSTTITNALFQHVASPIWWWASSGVAPGASGLVVRNSTFRGFSTAVLSSGGTLVADSNTFVNGTYAVFASGPKPMAVTRNRVGGTETGVAVWNAGGTATVTVADNVVTDPAGRGIFAEGGLQTPDTLQTVLDVRRNTVVCGGASATTSAVGIELRTAHVVALDNQVSGCPGGGVVAMQLGTSARRDSIAGNTVAVPANGRVGIGVNGVAAAHIRRNTVTGAATGKQAAGLIDVTSCAPYGACGGVNASTVIIDSNRVSGGTVWGIHAQDVDSLDIVGNQVENLNVASGAYQAYGEQDGAIAVLGNLLAFARVAGNVIRHIAGNGIVIGHSSEVTVSVDSNVVADIDSSGLSYQPFYGYGGVDVTRNLFTGARREGLRISGYGAATATGNNIMGNVFGARVVSDRSFDAPDNWWGAASGPSCSYCDGSGDSVSNVNWTPFRVSPNDSVPPLPVPAPPFTTPVGAAPSVRPAAPAGSLDGPIQGDAGLPEPRALRVPPTRPALTSQGAGPLAARRAAEAQNRAALDAREAAHLRQLRERLDALTRVRAAPSPEPRSQGVRP